MWDTLHESFYIFNNWIHYIIYEICVYEFLTWPEECSLSIEPINLLSKTKTVEHVSWGWGNFEGLLLNWFNVTSWRDVHWRLLDCLLRKRKTPRKYFSNQHRESLLSWPFCLWWLERFLTKAPCFGLDKLQVLSWDPSF